MKNWLDKYNNISQYQKGGKVKLDFSKLPKVSDIKKKDVQLKEIDNTLNKNNDNYKLDLLLKETKLANKDKKQLYTKGYIENPQSIYYKNKEKKLDKKKTFLSQDNRSEKLKELDNSKGEFEIAKKEALKRTDVVTDVIQLGNFVPHPLFQEIGKIGNVLGTVIDSYQSYDDFSNENYIGGTVNVASAILPNYLDTKSFSRNSKYSPISKDLNNLFGDFGRTKYLNTLNQVRNQSTQQLNTNRALLGALGTETIIDSYPIEDKQYQNGGIIKDNNGYWNSDNWGKTVEINSPNITMNGVLQPLIGISKETGEKRIMYPGESHKFAKTKHVIEKPLTKKAKNGSQINPLDLLESLNAPKTKNNWLNKYN